MTCDYLVTYRRVVDPMAPVFRALSDPSRRLLLDRLFERDGQRLDELCSYLPEMTRFGVMRHLGVLETAGLITTRKVGREKRHYLNPVPIRLIPDRWIGKFAAPVLGTMTALKDKLEDRTDVQPRSHLQRPHRCRGRPRLAGDHRRRRHGALLLRHPGRVRLGDRARRSSTPTPTAPSRPTGRSSTIDPPNRVTLSFHARWDPDIEAEGPVQMTWEVEPQGSQTKLTVTMSGMGPRTAQDFVGGIVYIVSNLKTLLETGSPMAAGVAAG